MKSKIYNRLAISLTTSILVLSTPKVFAQNVQSQLSQKEPQPLFEVGSLNSTGNAQAQMPGFIQQSNAIEVSKATQHHSVEQTDRILEGLFATLVFGYILLIRQQKRHRATTLLQQIETLERIWQKEPHR